MSYSPPTPQEVVDDACIDAMLFSSSYVFPVVLHAAIELEVLDIMAESGPKALVSAAEVVSRLATTNPDAASMLDRMLTLLATQSFLRSSSRTLEDGRKEKLYGLTPASRFFLRGEGSGSLAALSFCSHHRAIVEVWLRMKDVILVGGDLFKKVHGIPLFEYMEKDPSLGSFFDQAMGGSSKLIMERIVDNYKGFEGLKSLVDVGGGYGSNINVVVSKYPSIMGINYDMPHVIQNAPQYPGIQHVGGDMFKSVPTADAIMVKEVCHDWDDVSLTKILKNIHEALPENGKLIIVNAIIPEEIDTGKESQLLARLDNTVLTQFGGRERTAPEFEAVTKAAGFANFRLACVVRGICAVMESYKRT